MKKTLWIIPVVFLSLHFGFCTLAVAGEEDSNPRSLDSRYENMVEELEKTKEITQIWKDHVKTLTKERDEAYKQIEALQNQTGSRNRVLAKGGVEVQSIPVGQQAAFQPPETARQIKDFKYQIDRLQYDNEKLKLAEKEIEGLKSQIESFRSESENARLIQKEFEAAKDVKAQLTVVQAENVKVKADKEKIAQAYSDLKNQSKSREKELQDFSSRANELEKANQELRDKQNTQLKAIESLKASLQSDLYETQKLKASFESSLETLLQNFDEKQNNP